MNRSRSGPRALVVLAGVVAILATACGGSSSSSAPSAAASASAAAVASAAPSTVAITPAPITGAVGPNGGVVVRWFIGIGSGGKPEQVAAEQKFAETFNNDPANKDKVYLSVEIYDNKVAADQLAIQIAAGNPPDIIGPVGVEGLNIFRDNLLDLKPLITSHNFDMTKFDPALANYFDMGKDGATIGVPYATYPSFIYYNKKLFDEAKLPYPPTKVGDMYQGKTWDMDAVKALGMKLTVDNQGVDATDPAFDPKNIVQWGFDMQWADDRSDTEATIFGASSVVAADGKTAQISDQFTTGLKWFNDGVWKDHFIPTKAAIDSKLLSGNEFQSGNVAMVEHPQLVHLLHQPGRARQAQFHLGRRGQSLLQRRHDRQVARGHVQPPQHDQAPGRGVRRPRRLGRVARAAHQLRRVPGRSGPAAERVRRHPEELPGLAHRLHGHAGDARLRRQAKPPGLDARLPEGQEGPPGCLEQVSNH